MTSSNINKIVRSNITLKPWILSKNTSEIVNTCIQKIYRQSQNNFKNDQSKSAAPKPENKGPIRALKSQERERIPLSINVSRAKKAGTSSHSRTAATAGVGGGGGGGIGGAATIGNERFLSSMIGKKSAVANLTAHRKLLKSSPNYKIYSSRRFGSSASSSNASIFRRNEERRRISNQTAHFNYLLRSFGTQMNARGSYTNYGLHSGATKYMTPARNQHMESRTVDAISPNLVHMTSALQRDLMPLNSTIKDRIALGRSRLNRLATHRPKDSDPMNGWHHPPSPEIFLSRFNERGIANAELQEQYRRMKTASKMRQFEQLRQMEKRASIMGTVGRKTMRPRFGIIGDFNSLTKEATPRNSPHLISRTQSQTLDRLYSARFSRKPLLPTTVPEEPVQSTIAPVQVADAASPAPPPAAPSTLQLMDGQQKTALPGATQLVASATMNQYMPMKQMEDHSGMVEAETPLANAAVVSPVTANFGNPMNMQSTVSPAQFEEEVQYIPSISKNSATSVVVKGQNAYNNMRFNRSAYLRKY